MTRHDAEHNCVAGQYLQFAAILASWNNFLWPLVAATTEDESAHISLRDGTRVSDERHSDVMT